MKKVFLIAAAVVALAACSKNEVLPSSSINNEISFNVAPRTKALAAGQIEFNTNLTFQTYAYYLPDGQTWASHTATPQTYIDNAKIEFVDPQWKNATHTYYWPKQGKLTFLSWTAVKEDWTRVDKLVVNYAPTDATCAHDSGLKFSFDAVTDKNKDILVADIAADKNANESVYLAEGVPTLFKHQLSYVVFKVRTDKDYTTAGKKFELNSIKFGASLSKAATYQQIATIGVAAGWTETAKGEQVYYNGGTTPAVINYVDLTAAGATVPALTSNDTQNLYLPQTFAADGNEVTIQYTITTTEGASTSTDVVTKTFSLNPSTGTSVFTKWEPGKRYTCTLTFSLDEITWDPAVQDWENVSAADITIK